MASASKRNESEQTQRDSEGQGSLAHCSPWGHIELDTTERLSNSSDLDVCQQDYSGRRRWGGFGLEQVRRQEVVYSLGMSQQEMPAA